ncbi:hypothetical protein AAFF_G00331420 [Aldrovandia affinis]|uniref:Uncharacterized protein n=1 Tax=Aldrovandia affinis TaxID=143900 RepID=A0AAD7SLR5_9TELE|nr:hypothetical protein AAFF_G00331420 [Aldrovandia affinis]
MQAIPYLQTAEAQCGDSIGRGTGSVVTAAVPCPLLLLSDIGHLRTGACGRVPGVAYESTRRPRSELGTRAARERASGA